MRLNTLIDEVRYIQTVPTGSEDVVSPIGKKFCVQAPVSRGVTELLKCPRSPVSHPVSVIPHRKAITNRLDGVPGFALRSAAAGGPRRSMSPIVARQRNIPGDFCDARLTRAPQESGESPVVFWLLSLAKQENGPAGHRARWWHTQSFDPTTPIPRIQS